MWRKIKRINFENPIQITEIKFVDIGSKIHTHTHQSTNTRNARRTGKRKSKFPIVPWAIHRLIDISYKKCIDRKSHASELLCTHL